MYTYVHCGTVHNTKDLDLRPEIIKILENNIGKTRLDTGLGKDFMTKNPKANAIKTKNNSTIKKSSKDMNRHFSKEPINMKKSS